MRAASRAGTRAHHAAEKAFRAGESEFGIHMAYLAAARQIDAELPYASIVGLNGAWRGTALHEFRPHATEAKPLVPDRRRR